MKPLAGRRALITGAGRGVGAATAKAMARAGAEIVLAARNAANLDKVKAEIEAGGGKARAIPVDLSTRDACRALAAQCGAIDILVNNAAMTSGKFQSTLTPDDAEWDFNYAVTFTAPLILMQELGRGMVERKRGVILNISSMAAQRPVPYHAPYGVFKAALDTLSRVAAIELASEGSNVRVNSIALGHVDTEALAENLGAGITPADVAERNSPLIRPIKPDEVADFLVYLSTDSAAPFIGAVLNIDGGLTAGSYSFIKSFGPKSEA